VSIRTSHTEFGGQTVFIGGHNEMNIGETKTFSATVLPDGISDNLVWITSLAIDNGIFTAPDNVGTEIIRATATNGW
jgi:uncharacterized protein YjdB